MIWGCVAITALVWVWHEGEREFEEWLAVRYGHLPPEKREEAFFSDHEDGKWR